MRLSAGPSDFSPPQSEAIDLDAVRRPQTPPKLPPASLRVRLSTTPWLRRLLPTSLVVRRAVAHGHSLWEHEPEEHERALAAMEAIVGGTARADEVQELALAHLIESSVNAELFWQPWRTAKMDADSDTNLREALSSGRGVVLSGCHMGPVFEMCSVVTALGKVPIGVAAPWFFEPPTHDYPGRRLAHWWQSFCKRNQRAIQSVGSYPLLRALLCERELVLIYFDMPGSRETHFLGKPVMLATGNVRLARETDALILPLRARRVGSRSWVDVSTPLDPRDHADADELHDALAAVHERWILELPATIEDPRRPGAWEQGATAQSWRRPEHPPGNTRPERAPDNA